MGRKRKRVDKILQRPTQMRFEEVQAILEDSGFVARKSTNSHVFFVKATGGRVSVPKRGGRWAATRYLDQLCELLGLDELDSSETDAIFGPDD